VNLLSALVASDDAAAATRVYLSLGREAPLTAEQQASADVVFACLVTNDLDPAVARRTAEGVLAALPGLDPDGFVDILGMGTFDAAKALARYIIAYADLKEGRFEQAADRFTHLLSTDATSQPVWRCSAASSLAFTRAWQGRLREARRLADGAIEVGARGGNPHHRSAALAYLALALVATGSPV
jgi:hypothetical protein